MFAVRFRPRRAGAATRPGGPPKVEVVYLGGVVARKLEWPRVGTGFAPGGHAE